MSFFQLMSTCTFCRDTCNSTRVARISKKHGGWVARFVEIHATQPEFVCFLKYVQVVPTLTNDMFLSLGYTFHRDTCNSTRVAYFSKKYGVELHLSSRYVQLNLGWNFWLIVVVVCKSCPLAHFFKKYATNYGFTCTLHQETCNPATQTGCTTISRRELYLVWLFLYLKYVKVVSTLSLGLHLSSRYVQLNPGLVKICATQPWVACFLKEIWN
jgi:hypothetical protein